MTELTIAAISNDGRSVRTAGSVEDPLFKAQDVVESLGGKWNGKRSIEHVPQEWRVEFNSTPSESPFYLTELGLYFYLNRSDSPNALPWQMKVAETLKAIRQGKAVETKDQEIVFLKNELYVANQKQMIFEENFPAKLYTYDEAAGYMLHYVRPPFGPEILKRWLVDRRILCDPAYKNCKPIQRYLDNRWFIPVISEWYAGKRKHSENRYYLSRRGLMGIIDIAIRERLVTLPAARQACLPGLFEDDLSVEAGGAFMVHAAVPVPHRLREPEYAGPGKPR